MSQNKKQIELYNTFRKIKLDEKFVDVEGVPENYTMILQIAVKVANATTEDEYLQFLKTGEVPAIKLSKKEMAFLKGGYFSFDEKTFKGGFEAVYRTGLNFVYQELKNPAIDPVGVGWNFGRAVRNTWDTWGKVPKFDDEN